VRHAHEPDVRLGGLHLRRERALHRPEPHPAFPSARGELAAFFPRQLEGKFVVVILISLCMLANMHMLCMCEHAHLYPLELLTLFPPVSDV
jgi:hypothetical protein